jgi:hypothetical protein
MLHNNINNKGDHYAVALNCLGTHVLVQLSSAEYMEQVRLQLTKEQAKHMASLLLAAANEKEIETSMVLNESYGTYIPSPIAKGPPPSDIKEGKVDLMGKAPPPKYSKPKINIPIQGPRK